MLEPEVTDVAEDGQKKKNKKKKKKIDDDESRMIYQQFIGNDKMTVLQYIKQHGVSINGFVRYECGQELASDE